MSSSERTVAVRSVTDAGDANAAFVDEGAMAPKPLEFQTKDYTWFRAEYTLNDRDLVVHFYLPERAKDDPYAWMDWWLNSFAQCMDKTAQEYFKAGPPRLVAKYTSDFASWWFKAQSYDHLLDPIRFLEEFFSTLDVALGAGEASQ